MSTNLDIFDTFIAAKQALDQLPAIKEELHTVRNDLTEAHARVADRDELIEIYKLELESLKASLTAKEAELASATFRETEATGKLNSLRDILGVGVGSPVAPAATSVVTESVAVESNPKVAPVLAPAETPFPIAQEAHAQAQEPEGLTQRTYLSETPTAISPAPDGVDTAVAAMGTDPSAPANGATPETTKPHANKPYWDKPTTMGWGEWSNGGGEVAPWMIGAALSF